MSLANEHRPQGTPVQPNLSSLLARFLYRQAEAHASGLAGTDTSGEVVPYEVGLVQPIDAKPAWEAAVAVAKFYGPIDTKAIQAPPLWAQLVSAHEPATALPFCFGNFPQLVRNYQSLLQTPRLAELRPSASRPVHGPALTDWAKKASDFPRRLLALGALRLAKQFDAADELVAACDAGVPAQWRQAWANEKAALAWERGQCEEALAQWNAMPESVPVLFNRGMAALFCGKPAEGCEALIAAVAQLPETAHGITWGGFT